MGTTPTAQCGCFGPGGTARHWGWGVSEQLGLHWWYWWCWELTCLGASRTWVNVCAPPRDPQPGVTLPPNGCSQYSQ